MEHSLRIGRVASQFSGLLLSGLLVTGLLGGLCGTPLAPAAEQAADPHAWPQFRGPSGQGHAPLARIPLTFDDAHHVRHKLALPGRGWSSPVIADGLCWLTTAIEKVPTAERRAEILQNKLKTNPQAGQLEILESVTLQAVAIDLQQGRITHTVTLFEIPEPEPIHSLNSYASPTPVLAGNRLLCHFGNLGTACVDTEKAQLLWKNRIPVEHGVGPGSTPVVYGDLLIFPCDGTTTQSVVALSIETGTQAWQTRRPPMTGENGDFHKAFSTPLIIRVGDQDQVVAVGAQWVVAYEPKTGREIWRCRHGEGFSNAPRPVFAQGLVLICGGYMTHELLAIRVAGAEGDVTASHIAWRTAKQVPPMSSPIVVGDEVYTVSDQGVVSCLDLKSGEAHYRERLGGNFSASPLFANGHLLFCSRTGEVSIVPPGPTWNEPVKNQLDSGVLASPAIYRDSLVVRTEKSLYVIAE
jgi:outer membrane protein assembly factor BamB